MDITNYQYFFFHKIKVPLVKNKSMFIMLGLLHHHCIACLDKGRNKNLEGVILD